jgi:glycerol-3-phosphate dehydrogenase
MAYTHIHYDVIIIGAGVIGGSIARELAKYKLKILILEKENDVSCGASKANSGIIHGGYDDPSGSMKAKFSRKGNQAFDALEDDLHFGFKRCGSLVIGFNDDDLATLKKLKANGELNGVTDLKLLSQEDIFKLEPHLNPAVTCALYCPSAGIASPYELTIALFENAIENGAELKLNSEVTAIHKSPTGSFNVTTNQDASASASSHTYTSDYLINAAGVYSDHIAQMLNVNDFTITPTRGEYILLNKNQGHLANGVIFQTPSEKGKGILVTKTYHGNLMLGPNAQLIDDKTDTRTTAQNLDHIAKVAARSIPNFNLNMQIRTYSGLRARSSRHDFIIEESRVKGFILVAGIESPGLTASPAIAPYVCELLRESGLKLEKRPNFTPQRPPIIQKKSPDFDGKIDDINPTKNIICRCEKVTEAEIHDALKRNIPVSDLDGVKRRTRARMGPCQGKFSTPRILASAKRIGLDLNQ